MHIIAHELIIYKCSKVEPKRIGIISSKLWNHIFQLVEGFLKKKLYT